MAEKNGFPDLHTTGDPFLDLVAAVYRRAIGDARQGKTAAIYWLAHVCPEWRDHDSRPRGRTQQQVNESRRNRHRMKD